MRKSPSIDRMTAREILVGAILLPQVQPAKGFELLEKNGTLLANPSDRVTGRCQMNRTSKGIGEKGENVPFLFVVDDTETHADGMMAYGDPIRTSIACGGIGGAPASPFTASVKWMTLYHEKDGEPEQHALVWHNACFAF